MEKHVRNDKECRSPLWVWGKNLRKRIGLLAAMAVVAGGLASDASAQDNQSGFDNLDEIRERMMAYEQELQTLRMMIYQNNDSPAARVPVEAENTSYEAASYASAADGDDKRLAAVEKALKKINDDAAKKKADDAKKPTQKWSGRVHWDYWQNGTDSSGLINLLETDNPALPPEDRIAFRRLRFGVAGDIPDNMTYKIEMEFANGAAFRDAYLGWKSLPGNHTLLLGNQKRPYGLDHLNSSRYNVFMERPLIVEAVNQDARRFGLCAYGLSNDEAWNWRYGVYNKEDVQTGTIGDYLGRSLQLEVAGRLANTAWYDESSGGRGYFHWAISGSWGQPDGNVVALGQTNVNEGAYQTRPELRTGGTNGNNGRWINTGAIPGAHSMSLVGLEAALNLGSLAIVGEFIQTHVGRDGAVAPDIDYNGGYVYVSYFLTGEFTPWERESGTLGRVKPHENFWLVDRCCGGHGVGWGAWEVAGRFSYADLSDNDVRGGFQQNATLGVNWWWNPNARVQFNYVYGEIRDKFAGLPGGVTPAAVAAQGNAGHFSGLGFRFMVDF